MKNTRMSFIRLLLIEIIALGVFVSLGMVIARGRESVEVPVAQWTSSYTMPEDGVVRMSADQLKNGLSAEDYNLDEHSYLTDGEVVAFSSPIVTIPKGDYTLTLNYGSNVPTYAGITVDEVCEPYITSGRLFMSTNSNVLVYHITAKRNITGFHVEVFYQDEGEVYLTGASITPNANGVKRGVFILMLMCVVINIIYIRRKWLMTHQTRVMMMTVAVILASLPLMVPGIIYGHDLMFHLNRIEGISQALMQHQFPVRMYPEWMDGYGYPVPIYYGDFLLYIPAIMRLFGFTLIASYKTYIVFVNIMTVIVAYVCFRRIFRDYKIAVVSACVYLLATYRLVDIYARASVGEYTAMVFLPIIAMSIYRIYTDDESMWKQYRYNALYLAIGMSGVVCTHILTTEMLVFSLMILVLILAKKTFSGRRLRAIGSAVLGTCVFSAWYVVPFVYHFLLVPTQINSGHVFGNFATAADVSVIDGLADYFPLIQANGAYLGQIFNVFGYSFGTGSTAVYERCAYTPGLVLMGVLLVAAFYWIRGRANIEMKVLAGLSVLFLWMSTNLFPWDFLGLHVSRIVTTLQIPSRFLSMADLCLTLLLGVTLLQIKRTKNLPRVFADPEEDEQWEDMMKRLHNRRFRNAMFAVMVGCVFTSCTFLRDALNYDFVVNVNDAAELDSTSNNSFVCLREGSVDRFPVELSKGANVGQFEITSKSGNRVNAYVETTGASYIEIPKLRYPGYKACDDGGNVLEMRDGTNNIIRVMIGSAYSGNIRVEWKEPISWRIAELVTLLGFLYYLFAWIRRPKAYRSTK